MLKEINWFMVLKCCIFPTSLVLGHPASFHIVLPKYWSFLEKFNLIIPTKHTFLFVFKGKLFSLGIKSWSESFRISTNLFKMSKIFLGEIYRRNYYNLKYHHLPEYFIKIHLRNVYFEHIIIMYFIPSILTFLLLFHLH